MKLLNHFLKQLRTFVLALFLAVDSTTIDALVSISSRAVFAFMIMEVHTSQRKAWLINGFLTTNRAVQEHVEQHDSCSLVFLLQLNLESKRSGLHVLEELRK